MYQQNDKRSAVREIQKYLYVLSDRKYETIPRIPIDGIFDEETKAAVIEYQKIKLLTESGIVDFETFTALYGDYLSVVDNFYTNDYIIGDSAFPLSENEQSEDVRALHLIINELRKSYPQIASVGTGSYFSKRTGDAIEALRELFIFPKSREVDKELYRRLISEINARNQSEIKT